MGALSRSRKNIDAETMYEMRRQGMGNAEIAKQLGVSRTTVHNYIGKQGSSVKRAEWTPKKVVIDPERAVVDHPKNADKPPFMPLSARVAQENTNEAASFLTLDFAQYNMKGELWRYIIDTSDGTVELMSVGNGSGLLDKSTIGRFIKELQQVEKILQEGKVSA